MFVINLLQDRRHYLDIKLLAIVPHSYISGLLQGHLSLLLSSLITITGLNPVLLVHRAKKRVVVQVYNRMCGLLACGWNHAMALKMVLADMSV